MDQGLIKMRIHRFYGEIDVTIERSMNKPVRALIFVPSTEGKHAVNPRKVPRPFPFHQSVYYWPQALAATQALS